MDYGFHDQSKDDVYYSAAICRRGHVESELDPEEAAARCSKCGAVVLTACSCGQRIRGPMRGAFGSTWMKPQFCDACGRPHPWASREARFYELENILDEQDLDPADELKVREELEKLREQPEAGEAVEIERWKTVKRLAPGLMEAGGRIMESVMTAAIKAQMNLP